MSVTNIQESEQSRNPQLKVTTRPIGKNVVTGEDSGRYFLGVWKKVFLSTQTAVFTLLRLLTQDYTVQQATHLKS